MNAGMFGTNMMGGNNMMPGGMGQPMNPNMFMTGAMAGMMGGMQLPSGMQGMN